MNVIRHAGLVLLLVTFLLMGAAAPPLGRPPKMPAEKPPRPAPVQELLAKNKELVPALIAALKDTNPEVRQTTSYTLVQIGKDAVPGLVAALGDMDPALRANAAYVLAGFGALAQDALPALVKALKDGDSDVRRRAAYAINRILEAVGAPQPMPQRERSQAMPVTPGVVPAGYMERSGPVDPGLLLPRREPAP